MSGRGKLIKASEIGEYVFCARAWRLRLDGHEPGRGGRAREAGTRWHLEHGRGLRRTQRLRMVAILSALLAIAAALLLFLLWWGK